MNTIYRAALIEAAAEALEGAYARWSDLVEVGEPVIESEHEAMAAAVVPVVVAAVLKPLRELHKPLDQKLWAIECTQGECDHWTDTTETCEDSCPPTTEQVCAECYRMGDRPDDGWEHYFSHSIHYPCPTIRLLDQIESDAKGDE